MLSEQEEFELLSLERERAMGGERPSATRAPQHTVSEADMLAGTPAVRFAMGAAAPVLGVAQLADEATGGHVGVSAHLQQVEEMKRRGMSPAANLRALEEGREILSQMPGYENALADIDKQIARLRAEGASADPSDAGMDVAGAAGMVVSPAFLAAAKAVPGGLGLVNRILTGMGLGAAGGASTPVTGSDDYWRTKATQTGAGALVGGAIPAVAAGAKKVGSGVYHSLIEPIRNSDAIKGRAYLEAAGDKADDVIAALRRNEQLVPGSRPTAGEAAAPVGSAEFSALQRSASNVKPSEYFDRALEQRGARAGAIRSVGQSETALASAEGVRQANAAKLYGLAYQSAVRGDPELAALSANPYFKEALPDAFKLAQANGVNPKQNLTRFLHFVKLSLDKQLAKRGDTALSNTEQHAVEQLKTQLVDWMGRKNPAYEAARAQFAADSVPINQMQVGQQLEKKLVPALADDAKQTASTFANAVREAPATIKKATGQPRYEKLENVLSPEQMQVVQSIQDDLARGARFEELAVRGSKAAPNAVQLATQSMEREAGGKFPNLLHRGAMLANAIITRLEGKINKKLAYEIASDMLNPPSVAETMEQALMRQRRSESMARAIERITTGASAGVGAAAGKRRE